MLYPAISQQLRTKRLLFTGLAIFSGVIQLGVVAFLYQGGFSSSYLLAGVVLAATVGSSSVLYFAGNRKYNLNGWIVVGEVTNIGHGYLNQKKAAVPMISLKLEGKARIVPNGPETTQPAEDFITVFAEKALVQPLEAGEKVGLAIHKPQGFFRSTDELDKSVALARLTEAGDFEVYRNIL